MWCLRLHETSKHLNLRMQFKMEWFEKNCLDVATSKLFFISKKNKPFIYRYLKHIKCITFSPLHFCSGWWSLIIVKKDDDIEYKPCIIILSYSCHPFDDGGTTFSSYPEETLSIGRCILKSFSQCYITLRMAWIDPAENIK